MKRAGTKKQSVERRKRPRSSAQSSAKARAHAKSHKPTGPRPRGTVPSYPEHSAVRPRAAIEDICYHCSKDLSGNERALFVEEEVGRVFCSESCITAYFAPEIERLEKDYLRRVSAGDLSAEERESYSHLRWITLQEADEVWREKTLSGDHRFTLISEFEPGSKRVWCVCICLFLRGEPSFLYIAFTTRSQSLVNAYRRGERMQWDKKGASSSKKKSGKEAPSQDASSDEETTPATYAERRAALGDRLADAWTEDETFLAQMNLKRSEDDIPPEEFELFQSCLEETLETPNEVWSVEMSDPEGVHLYHFIREYPTERPGYWYVIVARETEQEDQIEILDAFPTRDINLVDRYRRGSQEVGESVEQRPASRLVH